MKMIDLILLAVIGFAVVNAFLNVKKNRNRCSCCTRDCPHRVR